MSSGRKSKETEDDPPTLSKDTHTESNYPIQMHTPPHVLAMLGLHEDNAHTLKSSDAQPAARLPSMAPDSLAKLEDEQEGLGLKILIVANINATSFGHACFLVKFPGGSGSLQLSSGGKATIPVSKVIRERFGGSDLTAYLWAEVVDVHYISSQAEQGRVLVIWILAWTTDEIMKHKIGIFNEDFLPTSR
ncbi:hypothetical protein ARMGADRAFT_1029324 [Armillaria gallica]|uniref:Uncharacterized protein n=1 Tax=Armillaria gallica TaxID=47427 RepID=A0A2H3DID8_ARMGA|nr:hypothetical protein ARMGADRAFT_1029324 [Armillaria gallica]